MLPLRDMVVFPFIITPLSVARELSIQAVDNGLADNRMILLAAQRDKDEEQPQDDDLYRTGTVAVIMRMLKLPDGRIRVLVQGVCRARIKKITEDSPYIRAEIERVDDQAHDPSSIEKEALMRSVKRLLERASSLGKSHGLRYSSLVRYRSASLSPMRRLFVVSKRSVRPARQAALPRWHSRLVGWPIVSRSAAGRFRVCMQERKFSTWAVVLS